MIIFSDSRDPIFNSRPLIGSLKHLKKRAIPGKMGVYQEFYRKDKMLHMQSNGRRFNNPKLNGSNIQKTEHFGFRAMLGPPPNKHASNFKDSIT